MRVVLALLADHASLTNDGKLNVLGIFEAFRPKQMPAVLASLSIVLRLDAQPPDLREEYGLAIRFRDPGGGELFKLDGKLNVQDPSSHVNAQQIIRIEALQVKEYGTHHFEVEIDGAVAQIVPLDVVAADSLE